MAVEVVTDPFADAPVEEVPLKATPLEIVVFQATFPLPMAVLSSQAARERIIREMQNDYPYAQVKPVFQFFMAPGQEPVQQSEPSSVLELVDPSQQWTFNISPESFSLATTGYVSRDDFLLRVTRVLHVVENVARPPRIARIGIRHINRVTGVEQIGKVLPNLHASIGSVHAAAASSEGAGGIQHMMSDLVYTWPGTARRLQVRWGQLPSGVVHEAGLAPVSDPSWIFDTDSVVEESTAFSPDDLVDTLRELAQRSYRTFRWAFPPDALATLEEVSSG